MFISFINTNNAELEAEVSALTQSLATMTDDFASVISRDAEILTLPSGVENVGKNALNNCEALTEITVPASVTNIEKDGFGYVPNLEKITFEGDVPPTIEKDAFGMVAKTCEIIVPSGSTSAYSGVTEEIETAANKALITITISGGTTELYYYDDNIIPVKAFYDRGDIISANIESGITGISERAFAACSGLTSLTMPDTVTTLGINVFSNAKSLSTIHISSGLTSLPNSVFEGAGLTAITVPDTITSVGERCFTNCYNLTNAYLPDTITTSALSSYFFSSCSGMTSVHIPNGIKNLGHYCFTGCTSLPEITLPSGLTTVGNNVFAKCSSLSSITCYATTAPTLGSNVFQSIKSTGTLYYPSGSDYSSWFSKLPAGWSGATIFNPQPVDNVNEVITAKEFILLSGTSRNGINTMFDDERNIWVQGINTGLTYIPVRQNLPVAGSVYYQIIYDANAASGVSFVDFDFEPIDPSIVAEVEDYIKISSRVSGGNTYFIFDFNQNHSLANMPDWESNPSFYDGLDYVYY